jgi:hypothetical protein
VQRVACTWLAGYVSDCRAANWLCGPPTLDMATSRMLSTVVVHTSAQSLSCACLHRCRSTGCRTCSPSSGRRRWRRHREGQGSGCRPQRSSRRSGVSPTCSRRPQLMPCRPGQLLTRRQGAQPQQQHVQGSMSLQMCLQPPHALQQHGQMQWATQLTKVRRHLCTCKQIQAAMAKVSSCRCRRQQCVSSFRQQEPQLRSRLCQTHPTGCSQQIDTPQHSLPLPS